MDLAYTHTHSRESIVDYICDTEVDNIINSINNGSCCSVFNDMLKEFSRFRPSSTTHKLKASPELKDIFKKMIQCFPDKILEKHHLRENAEYTTDSKYHHPISNDDIHHIWVEKRKKRKLQEQIITTSNCLKRHGLNNDVIEIICKKIKM